MNFKDMPYIIPKNKNQNSIGCYIMVAYILSQKLQGSDSLKGKIHCKAPRLKTSCLILKNHATAYLCILYVW